MKPIPLAAAVLALAALAPLSLLAETVPFTFAGPGVSGSLSLTYGTATDSKTAGAFELTGISGTFSDSTLGLSGVTITGLQPLNPSAPEPTNLLAPADFSRFPVASGTDHGSLNYDNLFYPGGSPQTASSYPPHGGLLDIYGVLFTLSNNEVVNLWSNGVLAPGTDPDYGVAVATSALQLDRLDGGVAATPEPGTLALLTTGLLGTLLRRRRHP